MADIRMRRDKYAGRSWPSTTLDMDVVRKPGDYQPTDADRRLVESGCMLIIMGKAIAKAELMVEEMGRFELAWYWTARIQELRVIDDLYLPEEQDVGSCHVCISPEAVAAANREVRRLGRLIVGAGHSHHGLGASTSPVDVDLFDQLSSEGVGFRTLLLSRGDGHVTPASPAADAPTRNPSDRTRLDVTLDICPGLHLTVDVPSDVRPDDVRVQATWSDRILNTLFSTHDAWGTLHYPELEVTRCGQCGSRVKQRFLPPATVMIIGDVKLTEQERQDVLDDLALKAPTRYQWAASTTTVGAGYQQTNRDDTETTNVQKTDEGLGESQEKKEVAPFEIYRQGEAHPFAKIGAAVLEEAAWRVPELRKALGWDEDTTCKK